MKVDGEQLIITSSEPLNLRYLDLKKIRDLDWQPGNAYYPDGSSRKWDGIRYIMTLDLMQVDAGGQALTLLPGVVNGVSMNTGDKVDHLFIKAPLKDPVFMEVLSAGKLNLLVYRRAC